MSSKSTDQPGDRVQTDKEESFLMPVLFGLLSLLAMPLVSRMLRQLDLRLGLQEERRY